MVEGNSLENCRTGNGTGGSNPSLSAKVKTRPQRTSYRKDRALFLAFYKASFDA